MLLTDNVVQYRYTYQYELSYGIAGNGTRDFYSSALNDTLSTTLPLLLLQRKSPCTIQDNDDTLIVLLILPIRRTTKTY